MEPLIVKLTTQSPAQYTQAVLKMERALVEDERLALRNTEARFISDKYSLSKNADEFFFDADVRGVIVGGKVVGCVKFHTWQDGLGISFIYVDKAHRRHGYAEMLLRNVIETRGSTLPIYLNVLYLNTAAIKLYEKIGFVKFQYVMVKE